MLLMGISKVINYYLQPEQSQRRTHAPPPGSATDSSPIHFRYICTVKQIQEIIQILTYRCKHNGKCYNRQGKIFNTEMHDFTHISYFLLDK